MDPPLSRHAVANGPALGDLLSRVAAGEEAALAALYEATGRRVFGLARRLLVERETAEQVTLEVYTQAWRLARTYDPRQGSLESWLLSLTCRGALDQLRRIRVRAGPAAARGAVAAEREGHA